MDTGLAGAGVVVTGASGGIGAACARAFAAEGARVLVHYHRGEERAREVADELGGAPIAQADLTDERDVERLFAQLAGLDVAARRELLAEPKRAEVIVAGAAVLLGILREFAIDELLVSESDILDGLAASLR